ncbi:MAG: prolipoprotein diacylglyceryl transferase [Salibacteraceae bacterium]
MNSLLYFVWTADPTFFELGPITVRWYGVLFAAAFMAGYSILQWIMKRENCPQEWMDSVFITVMIGTIAGARLGHVFFYQWDYYQDNLLEILMIWKGGLASHGATIGIILSLYFWSKRVSKRSILWILDRVVIVVALSGLFIRGGNFVNHEIVGKPTQTESGVKFMRNYEDFNIADLQKVTGMSVYTKNELDRDKVNKAYEKLMSNPEYQPVIDQVPNRYPAQLFEAFAYLMVFLILLGAYVYTPVGAWKGFIFGAFLLLAFGARFLIEFFKEVQVEFEEEMALDLGQWLSIPLVLAGIFFIARAVWQANKNASTTA